ncbi:hypothetical protein [Marinitenerispora sediminis]|uniref:Uncharacterized protein n=1 Tax=Marinitenerispora sediminis TaxID=1931232 RepID=A0A368T808_9ACTN|nr:hypothetical protein [Marinitenerispora sediminis]RCV54699.1 hypothetical protein DEF28_07700 [Marinitenerispora sediminis]RCV59450.1 hypothetical protein DEF23_07180 [Marinitenerispora sediminis]RCV60387.1 hypothetical protein DEF24_07250 [Marinitenerispora sediminis]
MIDLENTLPDGRRLMALGRIAVAFSGPDLTAIARTIWERRLWGENAVPVDLTVDIEGTPATPTPDWLRQYADTGQTIAAFFDSGHYYKLVIEPRRVVQATFDFEGDPSDLVEFLSGIPFEVASFATRYREWRKGALRYRGPGFGNYHIPHGWACAFKGDGHRNLVSRRWLETGPWRLLRGPHDTTLVQFHDLDLNAAEALQQARPAHEHMGIRPEGGYLQTPYLYRHDIKGLYDENRRVLKIVVLGRTVPAVEMRDACAARRDNALGPEQPIDNVAFIFPDPAEARAHLPRLWPYELECWTIIDGVETRLDTDQPPEETGA